MKPYYLIQILLPLYDNAHRPVPQAHYKRVSAELTERFKGLTAYTRAPAEGLWEKKPKQTHRDEIVIYEVMTPKLNTRWWRAYRVQLESLFRQEQIIIRAQPMRLL